MASTKILLVTGDELEETNKKLKKGRKAPVEVEPPLVDVELPVY